MPEPIGEIPIEITGDLSFLEKALQAARNLASEWAGKLSSAFNQGFEGAMEGAKSFEEGIKEWIEHPLTMAGDAARGFVEAMGPLGVAAAAAAVGVGLVGKEITNLVLEEGAAAEAMSNFADKLNLPFEEAKKLSEMADVAGVSIDSLARVSMRLATALEDPAGAGRKVAQALGELGVGADNSGEALLQLLQKLADIPDATERIAEANKIMGRSAVQLEPLLKDYNALGQAIDDLGGKLDSEAIAKLKAADDAADKLGISWAHLKEGLAATFSGSVASGLELLTRVLTAPPTGNLDKQIKTATDELVKLEAQADQTGSKLERMFQGLLGLDTNSDAIKSKELALQKLEALRAEADERKEVNAQAQAGNAILLTEIATEKAREEAAKKAATAAKARQKANDEAYKELLKSQKEVTDHQQQLNTALSEFGVKGGASQIAKWTADIEKLNIAAMAGEITWKDFGNAFADFQKKAMGLGLDMDGIARDAAILNDNLHKLEIKDVTNDFIHSEAAAAMLNATLKNFPTPIAAEFMSMANAAKVLGISIGESGQATTKAISALDTYLRDSKSLSAVELAWTKAGSAIHQLAKSDLPAAIAEYQKMIDKVRALGGSQGEILALEQQKLQMIIQERVLRGQSATEEIVQLEQSKQATQALIDKSTNLGNVYVSLMHTFKSAFESLESGIANAILNGKNLGDVFVNVGKQIAASILETIIKGALKPLEDELLKAGGLFDTLAKSFTGVTGKAASALGGLGVPGVGGGANASPVNVPGEMPPGGNVNVDNLGKTTTGGGAGALGGLASPVTAISSAVTAITSVLQYLQQRRMEQDIGRIEVTTRGMLNQLISLQVTFNTYLPAIADRLLGIWGALTGGATGGGSSSGGGVAEVVQSGNDLTDSLEASTRATQDYTAALQTTTSAAYSLDKAVSNTTDSLVALADAVQPSRGVPGFFDGSGSSIPQALAAINAPGQFMQGAMLPQVNNPIQYGSIAPVVGGGSVGPGGGAQFGNRPTVAIYAVDPNGRALASATQKGLEEIGIRTR